MDPLAARNRFLALRNTSWKELAAGRYVAAEKILEPHISDEENGIDVLGTYASALIYQGRFLEAHQALCAVRAHQESETDVVGTITTSIASCSWCDAKEDEAIRELTPYVEMLTRVRKVPRGKRLYAADHAGYSECAVLYFYGVRRNDQSTINFAETSFATLLERYRKGGATLESGLAEYLLGRVSIDTVAENLDGVDSFDKLAHMKDRGIFRDRMYLKLSFYTAVRNLAQSGDIQRYLTEMSVVFGLRQYHIDDEWLYARKEVEAVKTSSQSR